MPRKHRIKYSDLVDIPRLQALMENFSQVLGIANAVIDIDGTIIVQAGWQDACSQFHRAHAESGRRCVASDTSLANSMMEGSNYAVYRCHNGLIDTAAPIYVEGQHVASVFTGQFLNEAPDLTFFRQQAQRFGYDEARYLASIARLPILKSEQVEAATRLYAQLAGMLADDGMSQRKLTRASEKLSHLNKSLEHTVTERTQALTTANDVLAGREAMLQQILDTSSVAIFLVDKTGRITQANQRMAEMFRRPLAELLGSEYVSLIEPAEREIGRERMRALLSSAIPSVDLDRLYCRADGTQFWGNLTGKRFRDANGQENGLIGVIANINERKIAEEALRANEAKLRSLYELSPLGISLVDMAGRFLEFNAAFCRICGYDEAELRALDYWALTPREFLEDEARQLDSLNTIGSYGPYEKEYIRKDGSRIPLRLNGVLVPGEDGKKYIWSIVEDISERRKAEGKIQELAFFDQLTGLPNRTLLLDRLRQVMNAGTRSGAYGALLLIDLDNFKTLNDTHGHDMGDLLLKQVALRLIQCVRPEDTVARLGGDEFVVMQANLGSIDDVALASVKALGEKILATLNQPYQLNDEICLSSPSIGATLFRGQRAALDDLLKQADLAMYRAKDGGRNALRFFDPALQTAVVKRAEVEAGLRRGLERQQFALHYQAQVVGNGRVTGAEALIRWIHPERGMVSPAEFIPIAEHSGLILPLGQWVLETACRQLATWAGQPKLQHITLAVNVSARQFRQPDFVQQVLDTLQRTGACPERLKLELTESLLVDNVQDVIEKMVALKARGVGFSLDDFGTGYSSLAYLKRMPLDQLKIDQSFVRDVLSDPNDAAIARTVVALAHNLGLGVIAEGVETAEQQAFLASAGCHAYQGYVFSKPLPIEGFEAFARGEGKG
ncbi:MAG: EAL domain-containing protein [Rhodocyclales bacterium GT-UBC]|nr:MAG: EAL domain-containing protein [Rhodocyclales bacterium GT-UBC]